MTLKQPKLLFALFFVSLFTLSCEPEELVELKLVQANESNTANITSVDSYRSNLLVEGRFESTLESVFNTQTFTSYAFAISSNYARNGSRSARFEMRSSSDAIRSEISLSNATQSNRWYGTSLYFPGEDWVSDLYPDGWDIVTQWHATEDAGEEARFPPLALVVVKGRLNVVIYWATKEINTNSTISGKRVFDLGPLEKDKWLDMVYHINFSHQSDGVLEVWKNGMKVIDFNGPNSYNDKSYPYFKAGLYKRGWNNITKRAIYVDEVRVGNGSATYTDVAPTGSTIVELGNTKQLTLLLMNADTDLPIQTLTQGATLNLATLPTKKLNIVAATSTPIGSVVFNLTGAATKDVTQSEAPYTLFGDENGEFQAWKPVAGNYSLTATPYSEADGTGTAGKAVAIDFEVVDLPTDGTIPTVSMVINNDAATTNSRQVKLNIAAVHAAQMRFYDNSDNTWTDWEPAAATKTWKLSNGDGSKWVKVQVRNEYGVISASAADGIILRTENGTPTVTLEINKDAATTGSRQVTLHIEAKNAAQMRFYDNSDSNWTDWEPVAATKAWTLSSGDGSKWVKIQVRNEQGVMSESAADGIILKTN